MAKARRSRKATPSRSGRRHFRQPRPVVFFAVEGHTEEQYIRALIEYRYGGRVSATFIVKGRRYTGRPTSLKNLIEAAKREQHRVSKGEHIWIVCDVDQNHHHAELLRSWLNVDTEHHHIAMQSASIEGWFLQHFEKPARPRTNEDAFNALAKQWRGYGKGQDIPEWLIKGTDRAVKHESAFQERANEDTRSKQRFDDIWPIEGSSQLPALITFLDDLTEYGKDQ